jgi:hypothetical protein
VTITGAGAGYTLVGTSNSGHTFTMDKDPATGVVTRSSVGGNW